MDAVPRSMGVNPQSATQRTLAQLLEGSYTAHLSNTVVVMDTEGEWLTVQSKAVKEYSRYGDIARVDLSMVVVMNCVILTYWDVRSAQQVLMDNPETVEPFPSRAHDCRVLRVRMHQFIEKMPQLALYGGFAHFGEVAHMAISGTDAIVEYFDMRAAQTLMTLAGNTATPCILSMSDPDVHLQQAAFPGAYGHDESDCVARGTPGLAALAPPGLHEFVEGDEGLLEAAWLSCGEEGYGRGDEGLLEAAWLSCGEEGYGRGWLSGADVSDFGGDAAGAGGPRPPPPPPGLPLVSLGKLAQALGEKTNRGRFGGADLAGFGAAGGPHLPQPPPGLPLGSISMWAQALSAEKSNLGCDASTTIGTDPTNNSSGDEPGNAEPEQVQGKRPVRSRITTKEFSKFDIDPEKILTGCDTRTTVMVRNLTGKDARRDFLHFLERGGLQKRYSFFYMPCKENQQKLASFAFVNFVSPSDVKKLYNMVKGGLWRRCMSDPVSKAPAVSYARFQGHEELARHFNSSAVLHEQDPEKRPIFRPEVLKAASQEWAVKQQAVSTEGSTTGANAGPPKTAVQVPKAGIDKTRRSRNERFEAHLFNRAENAEETVGMMRRQESRF